jgi:hypothetical protein
MFPCGVTAESELESITETEDAGAPPIFTVGVGPNPLPRIVTEQMRDSLSTRQATQAN